jgi:hypothetical protein
MRSATTAAGRAFGTAGTARRHSRPSSEGDRLTI